MAINVSMVRGVLGSLNERTKLIAVAIVTFLIGMWFGGGTKVSSNGRFVPLPDGRESAAAILDTSSGQTWVIDANDPHHYRKGASISSWF